MLDIGEARYEVIGLNEAAEVGEVVELLQPADLDSEMLACELLMWA